MNLIPPISVSSSPSSARPASRQTHAPSPIRTQPRTESLPRYLQPPGPIRIGFVVHWMQVAGAEVLVRETIRTLGNKIKPTIFCLDSVGLIGEQLLSEGIDLVCLNRRPGRDYGVAWRLSREILRRRIQVVHAHQYSPFFFSALARLATCNAFRLILTEHGRHYPDVASPVRRAVNRLLLNRLADAVNACCQFSAKALCRNDGFSGGRIEVIDNGIDLSRYPVPESRSVLRQRLDLPQHRRLIATIARFHPVKDHATLLRAFAEVCRARSDVDLLLVGDGPGRSDLVRLAAELDISDRVRFMGIRRDIPDLLSAVDVFALTSVSEAASLTLMEAMASGLPVVVTNVGGNPELVRAGIDGLLFPRGDFVAGGRALLRLLDDPPFARACGKAAMDRAHARFSLSTTVDRYWNLYRRLAGRGEA